MTEAILRKRQGGWVGVANETVRDKRLSFRARGVLVYLLSKPDGWSARSVSIAADGTEGREAIRAALRELAEHGYYRASRLQGEGGKWSTYVEISETPVPEWLNHGEQIAATGDGFPGVGSPGAGSPGVGSPGAGFLGPSSKTGEEHQNETLPYGEGHDAAVVPLRPPAANVVPINGESLNQRVQRLTRVYAEAEPMCRFPAVMGIVKKAIDAGYDDESITAALLRLAAEGRSVTIETLRVELNGLPPRTQQTRNGGLTAGALLDLADHLERQP